MSTKNRDAAVVTSGMSPPCDNISAIILPANKMSRFSDPEIIMGCKVFFGGFVFYFG